MLDLSFCWASNSLSSHKTTTDAPKTYEYCPPDSHHAGEMELSQHDPSIGRKSSELSASILQLKEKADGTIPR